MPPPQRQPEIRRVNHRIWQACAGAAAQVPIVNSRVYYFPQGHMELCNSTTSTLHHHLSPLAQSRPFFLCRIVAVDLLANEYSDEVFAKLRLCPIIENPNYSQNENVAADEDGDDVEEKISSFAKILTPSDANNGGGFSVPRFCADLIFPPLNYKAEPPVQNLKVTDVHGVTWDFRHIYRGTPRRHLLTTGWSTFVNHKKLIAGDSVVFMRNLRGVLFVGIRRASRSRGGGDLARWREPIGGINLTIEDIGGAGGDVWGGDSGRVIVEDVVKAMESAAQGLPFEVVYYPKMGWSDFVVKAEVVETAMNVLWMAGMRVKMAVETDDSSRMTWFHGTVLSVSRADSGLWGGSPWRTLQVTWDEPEVLQNSKRVNPWQVEFVEPTPSLHSAFSPTKKYRVSHGSLYLASGGEDITFSVTGFNDSTMGHLNRTLLNYSSFPAGMQGARQNPSYISSFSNLINENTPKTASDSFLNKKTVPKLKSVSTELTIASSNSSDLSPTSQGSVQSLAIESSGDGSCGSTKIGVSSFKLFGQIIHMMSDQSSCGDADCTEDGVTKEYNECGDLTHPFHWSG